MASFTLELRLKTQLFQEHVIDKRLEIGRNIYNALAYMAEKRLRELTKTKKYRALRAELKKLYKEEKKYSKKNFNKKKEQINDQLYEMYLEYKLTKYSFHDDVKPMQKRFNKNINSHVAQRIADRVYAAVQRNLFGDGEEIHYHQYGKFNTLSSKNNKTGIVYKDETIYFKDLQIPVIINKKSYYEVTILSDYKIKYSRIVRKFIRGKYKYYVQLVFDGVPPTKINNKTGDFKKTIGNGSVGIDIGTQTIAVASDNEVILEELADKVNNIERQKKIIQRKMDRSKRVSNPENFDDKGRIIKNKKLTWNYSNRYLKLRKELWEIQRKQKAIRKLQHEKLANRILLLGDEIKVETMNFKALQKKSKKTKKNKKGKFVSKKRFGKSIANKAPAMLLGIIDRKLRYHGKKLIKVDTWKVKASQYNHDDDTFKKKKLSQRWTLVGKEKYQRDLYSAYLIKHVNDDLETINRELCTINFESFKVNHSIAVNKLKGCKNLSSIAI